METGLVFGLSIGELLTIYDQDSQLWKMSGCLFTGDYARYSEALPKSGIMLNGRIYEQATWVPRTGGKESGLWHIPTPQAIDGNGAGRMPRLKKDCNRDPEKLGSWRADLKDYVKMWPTPDCSDRRSMKSKQQGLSNAVKQYHTPTTRDWKGGRTLEGLQAAGRNENNSLNDKVNTLEQTTGQLNPQWADWLMGYPVGWTDLRDSEMQLSLK